MRPLFAAVALAAYLLDLTTKHLAVTRLDPGETHSLIGDLLSLHLTFNPGAAFSMGTNATVFLSLLAIAAVTFIVWTARRLGSRLWALSLGLLLAGIGGNLTDRVFRNPAPLRGHVIDFLQLPHWPVFNVADMAILGGGATLLLAVFKGIDVDGSLVSEDSEDDEVPAP